MRNSPNIFRSMLFVLLFSYILVFVAGCNTISSFNQYAYVQTTSLKVDALNLMSLADDEYSDHKQEVMLVITNMDKIYEYEKNRPKNKITLKMWDKLRDTSGNLFMGFMKRWKNDGRLNPAFINNSKDQVSSAFDRIAQLESKKIKQ